MKAMFLKNLLFFLLFFFCFFIFAKVGKASF